MHQNTEPYGIRLNLNLENVFHNNSKIHCATLSKLIDNQLKQSVGIPTDGETHFTDVMFEFDEEEMKCYLLYSAQPKESVKERSDFRVIYTNKQFSPDLISEVSHSENAKLQFYLCYAQSIVRKYINKRFKQ